MGKPALHVAADMPQKSAIKPMSSIFFTVFSSQGASGAFDNPVKNFNFLSGYLC